MSKRKRSRTPDDDTIKAIMKTHPGKFRDRDHVLEKFKEAERSVTPQDVRKAMSDYEDMDREFVRGLLVSLKQADLDLTMDSKFVFENIDKRLKKKNGN